MATTHNTRHSVRRTTLCKSSRSLCSGSESASLQLFGWFLDIQTPESVFRVRWMLENILLYTPKRGRMITNTRLHKVCLSTVCPHVPLYTPSHAHVPQQMPACSDRPLDATPVCVPTCPCMPLLRAISSELRMPCAPIFCFRPGTDGDGSRRFRDDLFLR